MNAKARQLTRRQRARPAQGTLGRGQVAVIVSALMLAAVTAVLWF